jgi:transcription-repair coupling factor (superfamily II helicase)
MEQPVPMDRLVCGDVGFGKTEVAVRAAFKAVQEGKQVAVLVPTTLLADQHHRTFKRRLAAFPVTIEVLSRFRSTTEQADVLARLQEGRVDILIGTHRLASQDVAFKDLGLLILDEEQRFGVGVKEQLRKLRVQVDTLTLTATPIPRTLQFSLMGARDLSIMATPPPNRQPIVTEIHTFNKDLIRDAILYETSRGGQVFFIHNRVHDIEEIALMLRGLVPNIRVRVAHGQLKSQELEAVMGGFAERRFEVLVSTNIIENGLDISNANTILIHRADHFGLSELHQLRGRVGRSDRKAFCYLLVSSVHTLTREAKQRLQAIEEFSDLGSGFNIAMRDLDIRGAGSLLGAEQSGFIEEVGFETYHKILEEAVEELRSEEFGAVFQERPRPRAAETTVDVEAHAYIPETYLSNTVERLNLYKRLSDTPDAGALVALKEEMQDRFGPLPQEVEHLIQAATLRLCARQLRLARVQFKNQRLFLEPPASDQDPWFYDHLFHPLLQQLSTEGHRYVLKETDRKRLRIIVQDVPTLARAQQVLETLMPADVGATAAPAQATT